MTTLYFDDRSGLLCRDDLIFDFGERIWRRGTAPADGQRVVEATEAVRLWHRFHGRPRVPVGVIGPRQPLAGEQALAETLGARIAGLGLVLLCGGRQGVMEAVCRGASAAGGLTIGILPDPDWSTANPYVDIPIATGLGPARNAIVARACAALVAVGGGYGTLSEMAFGLQFGRPVIALGDAPEVTGAQRAASVDEAVQLLALALLRLPPFAERIAGPDGG